jgi:TonB family protein
MERPHKLAAIVSLLLVASAAAAQESVPSPSTPADPLTRRGKMDPHHPLHIGSAYYPKESLNHREEGRCVLAFYINADGSVLAAQLLKSTGFPHLDTACIESPIDVPVLPAKLNGTPIAGWSEFKIVWLLGPPRFTQYPPLEKSAVPRVPEDYELQVGEKYYPESARAKHHKGYCVVHTTVDPTGAVREARITHSTSSAILDKACIDAVTPARFTPELQNGTPVEDSTDIAIYW